MDLKVAHLYPDLLNLYGDRGNMIVLQKRCEWYGLDFQLARIGIGDKADLADYDLIFIGGGQDREQTLLSSDLLEYKAESLKEAYGQQSVILAVCGGYQLLGNYYKTAEGEEIRGLDLVDLWTVASNKRMIGNVVIRAPWLQNETIVGFENHSGKTYLGKGVKPLGKVTSGYGNNAEDGFEGVHMGNLYGTYLHGSLLPKNPHLADHLIETALKRRFGQVSLPKLEDTIEDEAHQAILKRLSNSN